MSVKTAYYVTCPNGHSRKFYVTLTSVAARIEEDSAGNQEWHHLDEGASLNLYYCADCGAVRVTLHDKDGNIVEDEGKTT